MKLKLVLSAALFSAASLSGALYSVNEELLTTNTNPDTSASAGDGAIGSFTGTYDSDTGILSYAMTWIDLSSPITGSPGAHIHGASPLGTNSGVLHTLTSTGTESGSVTGSFDFSTNGDANESDFLNNLWYVNVHTTTNGSGELRSQLNPTLVPEPSVALLSGLAFLGLAIRRR